MVVERVEQYNKDDLLQTRFQQVCHLKFLKVLKACIQLLKLFLDQFIDLQKKFDTRCELFSPTN